ncbi:hypothetical protein HDU87_004038 [Geranomyces variabilis]|uniref:Protein CASP n=1 Tax=Geranomyces variabilis TaxID=109894 RepID=A0AAD5XVL6_9FUNG|nr:hypothetical protein HDU87_004038 [Geranomyces variabilis]
MIITAETGSGKTFAYLLPLLTRYLGPNGRPAREEEKMDPLSPRILILVPNRELCVQSLRVLHSLTAGMGITATTFPPPPSVLLSALTNPDIVVTTAAALDMACKSPKLINRFLARTQACIADEADWIASDTVGLRVLQHVSRVSKKRNQSAAIQFVFAAATLPPVLHKKSTTPREMIQRLFASIHKVSSKHTHSPPRGLIEEFLPVVDPSSRPLTLEEEDRVKCDALLALMLENAQKMTKDPAHLDNKWIVFCNDSRRAQVVHAAADALATSQSGVKVTCELLYGAKLSAPERSEKVLEFVSAGTGSQPSDEQTFRVLVSTDMVARGVDFRDVTTVVQVDFPSDASAYLHRVGRTARVGKSGRAISFVTPPDEQLANLIRDAAAGITDSAKLQNPTLKTDTNEETQATWKASEGAAPQGVERLPLTGVMSRNRSFSTKLKRQERRMQVQKTQRAVNKMEEDRLVAAVKAWQEIGLPALQVSLDAQGLEIVQNQKEGLLSRKRLAETTKEFRRTPDEEKLKEFKTLLKAYQSEIDAITRRSKTAETAFLNLYKVFAEAPDPASLFETIAEQTKQLSQLGAIQSENAQLHAELAQVKEMLASARKEEGSVVTLKARLTKYEAMLEEMVTEKVAQKEIEMKQAMDEKIRIYKETEYSLQRQVSHMKDQIISLQTTHEVTQARLVDHSEKYDEEVAAKLGELEIVMVDLDRANLKVAQLERDNDILKADLAKYRGNEAAGVEWQDPVVLAKKLHSAELELTARLSEAERLRQQLKEVENDHHQRVAELERDLAVRTLEAKRLETELLSYEDYDEIKRELDIVKSIEFDGLDMDDLNELAPDTPITASGNGAAVPLERLLLGKNKKLQATLTHAKVDLSATQAQLARVTNHLTELQAENGAQKKLISKLEEDMTKLENLSSSGGGALSGISNGFGNLLTGGVAGAAGAGAAAGAAARSTADSFSNLVGSIIVPTRVQQRLNEGGAGPDSRGEASSIVPILTAQRDRYRQRNSELEEELRAQVATVAELRNELEKLRDEQVKLYERLRYAQSFGGGGGSGDPHSPTMQTHNSMFGAAGDSLSSSSSSSHPRSRTNNNNQSQPHKDHHSPTNSLSSPGGGSIIPMYETRYETQLDPFAQFHQQEKARRVKEMQPLDRLAWVFSRMILGNRYLRSGFVVYCFALHALVWWAVFGGVVTGSMGMGRGRETAAAAAGRGSG